MRTRNLTIVSSIRRPASACRGSDARGGGVIERGCERAVRTWRDASSRGRVHACDHLRASKERSSGRLPGESRAGAAPSRETRVRRPRRLARARAHRHWRSERRRRRRRRRWRRRQPAVEGEPPSSPGPRGSRLERLGCGGRACRAGAGASAAGGTVRCRSPPPYARRARGPNSYCVRRCGAGRATGGARAAAPIALRAAAARGGAPAELAHAHA